MCSKLAIYLNLNEINLVYSRTLTSFEIFFILYDAFLPPRVRFIKILHSNSERLFFMQNNLYHYIIYFECSTSEEWYFRGNSSSVRNIPSAIACVSVLFFFSFFFPFITWEMFALGSSETPAEISERPLPCGIPDTEASALSRTRRVKRRVHRHIYLLSTSTTLKPYLVPTEREREREIYI